VYDAARTDSNRHPDASSVPEQLVIKAAGAIGGVLIVALAASLRWTPPDRAGDLRPRPDALEYESAARNLIAGDGYCIFVDGRPYPPRYAPGFSLLLAPVLALHDGGPGTGVVVVFAAALATIVATMAAAYASGGTIPALVAATMLALAPEHVRWSRHVMSDVPSTLLFAVITALLASGAASGRFTAHRIACLALFIGAATAVRPTNGVVLVPALLVTCSYGSLRAAVLLVASSAVACLPVLAYDVVRFGSPLRTGYALWAPKMSFALRYLSEPPVGGGTLPNGSVYARALVGWADLYPAAWAALIALGAICAIRSGVRAARAVALIAGSTVALLVVTYTPFFWQDLRFFLPALPALFVLASLSFGTSVSPVVRGIGLVLLLAGCLTLLRSPESYAPDKVFDEPGALAEISTRVEPDAALLLRTNDHFFRLLLRREPNAERLWVPLGVDDHQFAVRWFRIASLDPATPPPAWVDDRLVAPFSEETAEATIHALLGSGRPVYVSSLLGFQVPFFARLMRLLQARFSLERIPMTTPAQLYRITERSSAAP
jgi:hypothetical protein